MPIIQGGTLIPGAAGLDGPINYPGPPTSGAAGTGTYAGTAPVGALLIDTVGGELYQNTGTQASPTWTKIKSEA